MPYFGSWFGPVAGDDYFEDWFDYDGNVTLASGSGGASKSRILSNLNPRPQVPPWRQIDGAVGTALTEIRRFLHDAQERDELWGNHVEVTFSAADTSIPVATGLGGPAKAYKVVRNQDGIIVRDGVSTTPDTERGILWLQADGPGTVLLYIY